MRPVLRSHEITQWRPPQTVNVRKSVEKQDNSLYPATAITDQTESSDSEEDWQYVYRNCKQKLRYRPTIKSSSNSSSSVSSSDNSSEIGGTSVSTCDERRRNVCASMMKYIPSKIKIIPNKIRTDKRDNKKETQLPDATAVQEI